MRSLRRLSDGQRSLKKLAMARRKELKSLAHGIATFCVCRNNDIGGYWGLGVLCKHAQEISVVKLHIDPMSDNLVSAPEQAVRENIRERFSSHRRNLLSVAKEIIVTFTFEPYSNSALRGMSFSVLCEVDIKDDLGLTRSALASHICYPHNPVFE